MKLRKLIGLVILSAMVVLTAGCVTDEAKLEQDGSLDDLRFKVATQAEQIANLPAYAEITGVTGNYIRVAIHGEGNYPVIVTIYGSDLEVGKVSVTPTKTIYTIAKEYCTGVTLSVVVVPESNWLASDTIEIGTGILNSVGMVDYSTVNIGAR